MSTPTLTATALCRATGASSARANVWLPYLSSAMDRFGIDTPLRQAAFLAQIGHESSGLAILEENLNYSAEGLQRTFKKYFPTPESTVGYARNPEKIANRVYANRMGNGDEASGDGWRNRGRGPIQLTGRDNYIAAGKALGINLVDHPELAAQPEAGSLISAWFWSKNGLNLYADKGDIDGVSDVVNRGRKTAVEGDAIGYADRLSLYEAGIAALA